MADKVDHTKNAECTVKGTQLHIVVELDRDKVWISRWGKHEWLSSTEITLDTPAGPISVNVRVRTLAAGERAA